MVSFDVVYVEDSKTYLLKIYTQYMRSEVRGMKVRELIALREHITLAINASK